MAALFSDLNELKRLFDINLGDKSEDWKLSLYNEWSASIISEYLDRDLFLKTTTEYYNGTGSQKLLLRRRPVFPAPAVPFSAIGVKVDQSGYDNASGAFAADTALTYGTDYTLQLDNEGGTSSRSGILLRLGGYWPRPTVRQAGLLSPFIWDDTGSVQVTYTAGYTVDTLPAAFRTAGTMLVAALRYIYPLGQPLSSDGYEERSIGMAQDRKDYLTAMVKPLLFGARNWTF